VTLCPAIITFCPVNPTGCTIGAAFITAGTICPVLNPRCPERISTAIAGRDRPLSQGTPTSIQPALVTAIDRPSAETDAAFVLIMEQQPIRSATMGSPEIMRLEWWDRFLARIEPQCPEESGETPGLERPWLIAPSLPKRLGENDWGIGLERSG
jgi:hypothetical protein